MAEQINSSSPAQSDSNHTDLKLQLSLTDPAFAQPLGRYLIPLERPTPMQRIESVRGHCRQVLFPINRPVRNGGDHANYG
jgi:hypothetical protein